MGYLPPPPGCHRIWRNTFSETAERDGATAMRNVDRPCSVRLNIRKKISGRGRQAQHDDALAGKGFCAARRYYTLADLGTIFGERSNPSLTFDTVANELLCPQIGLGLRMLAHWLLFDSRGIVRLCQIRQSWSRSVSRFRGTTLCHQNS